MLRILSVVILIAGLLAAGIGGAALLESAAPKSMVVETSVPAAEPASAPAPIEQASAEPASAEPPLPPSEPGIPPGTDDVAGIESAASDEEIGFSFQTEMEQGPAILAPSLESGGLAETAAAAPPAPAPAPSFEDTLKTVPVAHETPASAEYKRAFDVTFAIDATGDTTATDALPGRGTIEEGEARVSDRVEVRLSGASFNIVAASPPVQALSPMTENTWRWSVTPLTAGEHDLVFEVFAIDSEAVTPLRTFQDTVSVKVSGLNRAIEFADHANPLFVLLGGLGSALAGLFGAIKFFGKK